MGACGCGDTSPDYQFKGPDGIVYGLQIYHGCSYCDTPAGFILYRWDAAGDDAWFEGVPELPWRPYTEGAAPAEFAMPIVGAEQLMAALVRHVGDEPVDEFVRREVGDALDDAIRATRRSWEKGDDDG